MNENTNLLVLQKSLHFLSPLKFYTFLRELAVIMIIQLSKNIRFIGVCVEKESARTIRAQTAPVGWLIKFNTGRLCPKVHPLTLLYTILAEKMPLLYTFY